MLAGLELLPIFLPGLTLLPISRPLLGRPLLLPTIGVGTGA